jgi:recombination protein RecT
MAEENNNLPVVVQYALKAEEGFTQVEPDIKVWNREKGFALQILRSKENAFKGCDPASIRDAVINLARCKATLNPALQQAFLIPRTIDGVKLCCLDISYRGLVKIATQSPSILDIDSVCVYEQDEFYMEQGLHPILKHVPVTGSDRGEQIGVYARAVLQGGISKFMYMNMDDVKKAKEASRAKNSPAWKNWPEEMARKTVVKRFCKLLPQAETLHEAVAVLNEHEGIDTERDRQSSAKELAERFEEKPDEVTGVEVSDTDMLEDTFNQANEKGEQ